VKGNQVRYVLLAIIALAIVGVILRLASASGDDRTLSGLLPIQRDVIDSVVISTSSTEARLVRRGNDWTIDTRPAFAPKLDLMWSVVDNFDGAQLVAANKANHARMGVDPASGTEVIFFLGAAVQERFTVGHWTPGVRQCFLRRGNEDQVYSVNCQFADLFDPEPDGWRDPIIVSVPLEALARVTIRFPSQGNEFFEIDLTGQVPLVIGPDGSPEQANLFTVEALARSLQVMVATGFATAEETADLNSARAFEVPDASVLVKPREGLRIETQILQFIRRVDGDYYVKNTLGDDIFLIDGLTIDSFVLPIENYLIPEGALP
jgi:hypothetical protein